jgi:predicted nucleic acid-binding protein
VYFVDASALVKLYIQEVGSTTARAALGRLGGASFCISPLVACETLAATAKKLRKKLISGADFAQVRADLENDMVKHFVVADLVRADFDAAFTLVSVYKDRGIGAPDLVHIATAHALQAAFPSRTVGFMCSDENLKAVARLEGLDVFDPETDALSALLPPD